MFDWEATASPVLQGFDWTYIDKAGGGLKEKSRRKLTGGVTSGRGGGCIDSDFLKKNLNRCTSPILIYATQG